MESARLWIGTFPEAGIGTPAGLGEGIWRTDLDLDSGRLSDPVLACATPAPSFLVVDRAHGLLHATSEVDDGAVTTWRVVGDTLVPLSSAWSGGGSPTHLTLLGRHLVVSDYADGTVGVLGLDEDGVVRTARAFTHHGSGPDPQRQECAHAHSTLPLPDGSGVLVMDLGTDEVRALRVSGSRAGEVAGSALHLPGASGPRHGAWRRGGTLVDVTCELSGDVATLAWDGRGLALVSRLALSRGGLLSHIAPQGGSARTYVADRGPGLLHVLEPTDPSGGGAPAEVGAVDVGSSWPRHFALVADGRGGEFVVVAGELAHRLHVLHRSPGEVVPVPVGPGVALPSPAFVLVG